MQLHIALSMYTYSILYHSTIFKTITNELGNTKLSINNGLKDLFNFNSDFFKKKSILNDSDINALKAYNAEIERGVSPMTAYYRTMQNASDTAASMAKAAGDVTVNLEQIPKVSKAAEIGLKALSTVGNMALMWGISEAIQIISSCANASNRLKESAESLNSTFSATQSDINNYKTRIEDLYKIINNNSSSYEDTYNARQELLTLQDEMIEKFGDEAEAVGLVTNAINGQTDALDTLTQNEWNETKNKFNNPEQSWTENIGDGWANFLSGSSNNFDRMINEMEDTVVTFHMFPSYDDKTYKEFSNKLQEEFGVYITRLDYNDDMFTLSGDLDDIYRQLLNIQSLAQDMGIDDSLLNDLSHQAEETRSTLESYEEIYSQHVLYDKIFNNKAYEESFDKINKSYKECQEAFATGDEQTISKAKQNFAEIVQGATDGLTDQSVIDYFNNMYPDLREAVGGWEFEIAFKSAIDDDSDNFENDVKDALSSFDTAEDIKNYKSKVKNIDYDTATDEQKEMIDNYYVLENVADKYSLTIDQLIDKLVQMKLIQSQAKNDLLDKLIPSRTGLTAGPSSILGDVMSGVNSSVATGWVDSLTEEELNLANSKEFEQALEEQKDKLNGTTLSAEDYEEALENVKESQEQFSDETSILSTTGTLAQVESLSAGLDQLDKIYADVSNKEGFDWSSILNNEDFTEAFGNMENVSDDFKKSYEEFIQTVSNSPDDIEACQQAFNNLATAYIYNSGVLDNLTEETKNATIAMLEQIGITNATEIVEARLAAQKEFLALKGKNLADATWGEISAIIAEGKASETTRSYLANLALAKFDINTNTINSDADVANIIAIANAAGASETYVKALKNALTNLVKVQNTVSNNPTAGVASAFANALHEGTVQGYQNVAEEAFENTMDNIRQNNLDASDFYAHYTAPSATTSAKDNTNGSSSSSEREDTIQTLNWIETKISRVKRIITNLGKTVSATYKNWTNRNNALAQELAEISNEINIQQQAYDRYMAQANSVGLSDDYKNLVMNGSIDIQTIQDDNLKDLIDEFTEWYEKALDCSDAIQDLRDQIADLAKQKFDSLSSVFDSKLGEIEHTTNMLEGYADQTEVAGYVVSTKYYEALMEQEKINIQSLQNEYSALTSALNEAISSGAIEENSEDWYDMKSSINEVEEAIQDANTSLLEYQNTMHETEWDLFDKLEDYISGITSESDFLIDLLDNADLYDDYGNFTNEGLATQGLHAVNFNTYMQQADDYAKELLNIDKELANDPYNVDLIERRNELLELQQEAISNAESEKDAIKDLISDGYDKMLDALQGLIDKRKEALQAEKDLYDYQQSIAEKTKTIAEYQKQLQAYEGDDSEEARTTIQQLKVNLEEAQQDLKDTEYDKWLSDQETMLDTLYTQSEEWINERLDDLDGLLQQAIDATNANAATISETITAAASDVGYTITEEMKEVWNTDSGIGKVVSDYSRNFDSTMTNVQTAISSIKTFMEQMKNASDTEAVAKVAQTTAPNTPPANTDSSGSSGNSSSSSSSSSAGSGASSWGSWFVYKKDSYPKNKLRVDTSIVDRLKFRDFDSSFSNRRDYYYAMGGSGTYTGSSSQNTWMIQQMKEHGYKNGGTIGGLIRKAGEDGIILARTGEEVLSLEKIKELKGAFIAAQPFIDVSNHLSRLTTLTPTPNSNIKNDIQMNIALPNVTNYNEFVSQLQADKRFEKIIQQMTIGNALGKNELTKYKF